MADYGKLIIIKEDGLNQEFILNKSVVTLGRATTNDIVLVEGRVSRNHAKVEWTQDGIMLTDLNSANGVWLNGQRIAEAKIQVGDQFEISGHVLQYLAPVQDSREEVTLIN
jgi:pSer/pThr/pTyr-binding forkhead associated (FHA) protein